MTSVAIDEKELEKLLNSLDFKNLIPKQIMGENGLLKLFNKKIIEQAMGSEMDQHLGYVKHYPAVRSRYRLRQYTLVFNVSGSDNY